MREISVILAESIQLQLELSSLEEGLAGKRVSQIRVKFGADMGQHKRDYHGLYWDPEYHLEQEKKDLEEVLSLRAQITAKRERLREIMLELDPSLGAVETVAT